MLHDGPDLPGRPGRPRPTQVSPGPCRSATAAQGAPTRHHGLTHHTARNAPRTTPECPPRAPRHQSHAPHRQSHEDPAHDGPGRPARERPTPAPFVSVAPQGELHERLLSKTRRGKRLLRRCRRRAARGLGPAWRQRRGDDSGAGPHILPAHRSPWDRRIPLSAQESSICPLHPFSTPKHREGRRHRSRLEPPDTGQAPCGRTLDPRLHPRETIMNTSRPLAVITGASSGIGFELAGEFARHGYDLAVTADDDLLDDAAARLRPASCPRPHARPCTAAGQSRTAAEATWGRRTLPPHAECTRRTSKRPQDSTPEAPEAPEEWS